LRTRCEFRGNQLAIELLVFDNGACPVADFLGQLTGQERRRIDVLFERLGNQGRISNKELFKKLEGTKLFEFKRHQIRLICFYTPDKRVVICHALRKKQDKHQKRDLDHAETLRTEYLKQPETGNDHERQ
jgi:phage-related protein